MNLRNSLIIIIICFSIISNAREIPKSGKYNIKLKVESMEGSSLSNFGLIYNNDTIYTDSLGYVIFQIEWEFRSAIKTIYKRKVNNVLNGKYISIESLRTMLEFQFF